MKTTLTLAIFCVAIAWVVTDWVPAVAGDNPDIEIHPSPELPAFPATEIVSKTPLQLKIDSIKNSAIEQVLALSDQLKACTPGSTQARDLELQIRSAKRESEIAILQEILADAIERVDNQTTDEAEFALDQLLHPENYPVQTFPSNRPAPAGR